MKTRSKIYIIDYVLYCLLLLFPLVCIVLSVINGGSTAYFGFVDHFTGIMQGNVIYDALNEFIGADGILPLLNANNTIFLDWGTYLVVLTLLHLIVDVIAFLPHLLLDIVHKR